MKKLAIVSTHPIQYNAPWFRLLAQRNIIQVKVFYTWSQTETRIQFDPGFGESVSWDLPLLEGYDYIFVKNISTHPGTHHFKGIINPLLNATIEGWKPDAILVFGWSFNSHLSCLRYFHNKIPVYFRGDSTLLDGVSFTKKLLRRLLLTWVYRHVTTAFYVGTNNKAYFMAHGLKLRQLIYAPHAIDNDRFAEPDLAYQKAAAAVRESVGILPNDLVILFSGKMETKKNPLFLVTLLKTIVGNNIKTVFVGTGILLQALQEAAATDDRIILMGFKNQQQMPVMYRIADLFILPSVGPGETWGLALNEAMASGVAVVATNKTGGAIDLIEDGVNGLIISPNNLNTCTTLIQQAILEKKVLVEMGIRSREKIKSFSFLHIVSAIEQQVINLV